MEGKVGKGVSCRMAGREELWRENGRFGVVSESAG